MPAPWILWDIGQVNDILRLEMKLMEYTHRYSGIRDKNIRFAHLNCSCSHALCK